MKSEESCITIELVTSGYVLRTPARSEVFTSTAKLNKAVRLAIDEFTLVPKETKKTAESEE